MLTLITNARIFAPEDIGTRDLLVAGSRIAALDERIDLTGAPLERIDAEGRWLLPGLVDALCHPCGGGGEGGFGNRTPELCAADFIRAGVTCPVGALGTDSVTRTLEVLFGTVMQLRAAGLSAHMYTGGYRVPAPTLTGDVVRDLMLVEPVIGVGEVAIADHRSSEPTTEELRRLASEARLGGVLANKGGAVFVHVGDGTRHLRQLREAYAAGDLPAGSFYPTHINRNADLLAEAADFARAGNWVDITASTTPELIAAGDIEAIDAFTRLLDTGTPAERISLSSDAGGSLPVYVDGQLQGLTAATPDCLLELVRRAVGQPWLPSFIAAMTANPARALGLQKKGRIAVGADADLLLLEPGSGVLSAVMGQGRWLAN